MENYKQHGKPYSPKIWELLNGHFDNFVVSAGILNGLSQIAKSGSVECSDQDLSRAFAQCVIGNNLSLTVPVKSGAAVVRFISVGSRRVKLWEEDSKPETATKKLMIIGKYPGVEEYMQMSPFAGRLGKDFYNMVISEFHDIVSDVYCSNFIKFTIPGGKAESIVQSFVRDFIPTTILEIELYKPDVVIFTQIGRARQALSKYFGVDIPLDEPIVIDYKGRQFVFLATAFSFSNIVRQAISKARKCAEGNFTSMQIGYQVIESADDLESVLAQYTDCEYVALDCEWFGRHSNDHEAVLRSIQLAMSKDEAYIIAYPGPEHAAVIDRFLGQEKLKIVGSFLYTDAIWLRHLGVRNLDRKYASGQIIDVALLLHCIDEIAKLDLCDIIQRYRSVPRWDQELNAWLKAEKVETYGHAPDHILYPYGAKDVAYLIDILPDIQEEATQASAWESYDVTLKCSIALSEIMDWGVRLDIEKYHEIRSLITLAYNDKLKKLREQINWPDFSPRKIRHRVEFLFGERYVPTRQRPEGAISLNLEPVSATGKYSRAWDRLKESERRILSPKTDKETCSILAFREGEAGALARELYDLSLLDQMQKTVFGKKGLLSFCDRNNRIHSFFSPCLKTGRSSSSRPNLQNLSKRRDEEYSRITGKQIVLRGVLTSDPGFVIIESDFVAAELFALAVMSRDKMLLEHCLRSQKPENDPDFYDIHSNLAASAFGLKCEPTKQGLKKAGKSALRTAAKAILYGLCYGRTPEAIQQQIAAEGTEVSLDDVKRLIDHILTLYSGARELLDILRRVPAEQGYQRNYFGRTRRFIKSSDPVLMAQQERESMNFPFQSLVADCLSLFMFRLWNHPDKERLGYRIILSIHDAVWLEVPERSVSNCIDLLQEVANGVKFQSWLPDGTVVGNESYNFALEISVCHAKL